MLNKIVVKVGTRLTTKDKVVNIVFMEAIAKQVATLHKMDCNVILVSSGAIYLGKNIVESFDKRINASVGQLELMIGWKNAFSKYDLEISPVLLTRDDIIDRHRCIQMGSFLDDMFQHNIVSIINENDVVTNDGCTFGENDNLAAMVAVVLTSADQLVFLHDEDGLMTDNPQRNVNAQLIKCIDVDEDLNKYVGRKSSQGSSGGMLKKVEAARMATDCGVEVVIANGLTSDILLKIANEDTVGSKLLAKKRISSKKAWLIMHNKPQGVIIVDEGAKKALLASDGNSLLPKGILSVQEKFNIGDLVAIQDEQGYVIAHGVPAYSSFEIDLVKGKHTSDMEQILGNNISDEIVHRDNIIVF